MHQLCCLLRRARVSTSSKRSCWKAVASARSTTRASGFATKTILRSGPHLAVNHDYFELDGHPLAVVGTTYMSSEVQRLYFEHPNVYMWNQDIAQIQDAGLNMIRTGWWTGWDKFCDENGQPYERTLRTLEAYLMTARKNGLPVQFNFFAFLPDVLGGANAFLDPQPSAGSRRWSPPWSRASTTCPSWPGI